MFRFIIPSILILVSVAAFLVLTNPLYQEVLSLREEQRAYEGALGNSKALENERDKLTKRYNSIDPERLAKLEKFLPESVENIRFILEIEKMVLPYGMILKDVRYDVSEDTSGAPPPGGVIQGETLNLPNSQGYGAWKLEFSTSGSYENFISFLRDLESNLRLVDISSISFSSDTGGVNPAPGFYQYGFRVKTYWLKK